MATQNLLTACCLLTLGLLAGCASQPTTEEGGPKAVSAAPGTELIASTQLPANTRINHAQSLILGSGDNWVGRVVMELGQNSSSVYNFFLEQYPLQGWTLVSAVRGKSSMLVLTKGDRIATFEMAEGGVMGGITGTLTVSPRSAMPAPAGAPRR